MAKKNNVEIYLTARDEASKEVDKAIRKTNKEFGMLNSSLKRLGIDSKEIDKINQEIKGVNANILEREIENARTQLMRFGADSKYVEEVEKKMREAASAANEVEDELKKAGSATEKQMKGIASKIPNLGTAIAAAVGVGVTALGGLVSKTIESTSEINKFSQVTGMSTKGFQQWDHVMGNFGYSAEQASGDLAALAEKALDASSGVGEGAELFKQLGVSVTDSSGKLKTQEQLFNETITALQGMEDVTERNALATALLSTTGEELAPVLNMSNEELQKMKENANVISDADLQKADKFKKSWDQVKTTFGGLVTDIGIKLLPIFQSVLDWTSENMPKIQKKFDDVSSGIGKAFNWLSENVITPVFSYVGKFVGEKIKQIKKFWDTDGEQFKQAAANAFNMIKSVIQFVMPFIEGVIKMVWGNIKGVINGALNIIMGAIKVFSGLFTGDFKKMWEGIKQIFSGAIEAAWNLINLMFIGRIIKGIGSFISGIKSTLSTGWSNVVGGIKTFATNAKTQFDEFVSGAKGKFDDIIKAAKELPGKIGKGIKDKIADATGAMKELADGLISKFKSALGINSPSKVFYGMAHWIIKGLTNGLSAGNLKNLGTSVFKDFTGGALSTLEGIKGFLSGSGAGGNVKSWIAQAMAITGVPSSWASALETIAMKESGGRTGPSTINNWDINAKRGTPSMGLMQTIMPTFSAYNMPGMNDIMNPIHNAVAAIRYIQSRYGTVFNTPGIKSMSNGGAYRGYARGGFVNTRQLAWLAEGGYPETVISHDPALKARSQKLYEQTGEKLGFSNKGGNTYHITVHGNNVDITEDRLIRTLQRVELLYG